MAAALTSRVVRAFSFLMIANPERRSTKDKMLNRLSTLTLSGHQEEFLMGCLLHLLCESAMPNIKMQRTEANVVVLRPRSLSAADLGVIRIQQAVDRKSHLVPIGSTMHG